MLDACAGCTQPLASEVPLTAILGTGYDRRHPYTKGLLSSIPRLDEEGHGELYAIPGMVPDIHDLPVGCRFADRCFQAEARCREESPPLTNIDADRRVACFFPLSTEE